MRERIRYLWRRLTERLWVRPLFSCLVSLALVLLAKGFESIPLPVDLPLVTMASLELLLETLAASMLVVATFAVGSMVAAYNAAAGSATPRTFPLLLADDTSQNALSVFIGSFVRRCP